MKILVAGATGAVGQPLLDLLIEDGHEVYGITQSKEKALYMAAKGVKPWILNVLDRELVFSSLSQIKPEVVIDMLTHLPQEYTPEAMRNAAEMDAKIRLIGGAYLQSAAEANGCKRYIAQSSCFMYTPGTGLADENTSFISDSKNPVVLTASRYVEIESRVLQSSKIEGVALRFGFFYGPGTWFQPQGNVAEQVRKRQFPVIGKGEGVWNFVHIENAAQAIVSSIYSSPGAYNIVNDHPSPMKEWLPAFARFIGAAAPMHISENDGLQQKGAEATYYATNLRGASNLKARQELHFQPYTLEWLL